MSLLLFYIVFLYGSKKSYYQFETNFFPWRFRFGKLAYFHNLILTHPPLLLFYWQKVKHGSKEFLPFLSCVLADLGFEPRALTSLFNGKQFDCCRAFLLIMNKENCAAWLGSNSESPDGQAVHAEAPLELSSQPGQQWFWFQAPIY